MDELLELTAINPFSGEPERILPLLAEAVYRRDPQRTVAAWDGYRQPGRVFFGVEQAGRLTGILGLALGYSGAAAILHLAVVPCARRQGVGRWLIEAVQRRLALNRLDVATDGEAVEFYRRCGFAFASADAGGRFLGQRLFVLPALLEPQAEWHPLSAGGKAAGLAHLRNLGFAIPPTWVVPAWRPWSDPGLALAGLDVRTWWRRAPECREARRQEPPDDALAGALARLPCASAWAVRSSCTAEDGKRHSLAGRFASCLDVPSAALAVAIRNVQASLLNDRALAALAEAEIDISGQGMAVLLQPMVGGRLSGVLTTADPVAGRRDRMRLAVVRGACAGAVDGSEPAAVLTLDVAGGVCERQGEASIVPPAELLGALATQALAADADWGAPLDIEWTWDGTQLWWLQARPLTAWQQGDLCLGPDAPIHRGGHWFLGHSQPHTALAQDVTLAIRDGRRAGASEAVCRLDCVQETAVVDGYIYHHRLELDRIEERSAAHACAVQASEDAGADHFHAHALPILADLIAQAEDCADGPRDAATASRYLEVGRTYAYESARLHWVGSFGGGAERFRAWLQTLAPELDHADWQDLVAAETGLDRERAALRRMAHVVQSEPALRDLFRACVHDCLLEARLDSVPGGERLRALLGAFAPIFGVNAPSYCGAGACLSALLEERPDQVLAMLRPFVELDLAAVDRAHAAARSRQGALEAQVRARVTSEQRFEFQARLVQARLDTSAGGDHHWYEDRRYRSYLRRAMRFAGDLLVARGQLAAVEDAEHLHAEELAQALADGRDRRAAVALRRRALARQRGIKAPPWLGELPPSPPATIPVAAAETQPSVAFLNGLSGLHATVEGLVYRGVPKRLAERRILVLTSRFDDYAHLLAQVAGVICEWGSPFEHVGILARELGVPVLYQVKGAGHALATGDRVRLDGVRGIVEILGKAPPA